MFSSDTLVRRLRIRANAADPFALQRRVAMVAAGADLQASLPNRAAVLCVRRLRDPRPGTLQVVDRLRPDPAWESAVRSRMRELAAGAARPVRGSVAASAEAVLFLDRAELLACLASDWIDGRAATCWWWRALFGAVVDLSDVVRVWREETARIPAACSLLAEWRRLEGFVRRLPLSETRVLTADLARTFGIASLVAALDTGAAMPEVDRGAHVSSSSADTGIDTAPRRASLAGREALRYANEIAVATLAPEQRLFVVAALVLQRAPSRAQRLLTPDAIQSIVTVRPGTASGASLESPEQIAPGDHEIASQPFTGDALPGNVTPSNELATDAVIAQSVSDADAAMRADPHPVARTAPAQETVPALRPRAETIETHYGGVFYLINVAIALGFYADFTQPQTPGIDLPIWDFLALLGGRLAGEEFASDPVVPLLARLAGRDPVDPPGATFAPADAPTVDAWLDAVSSRVLERLGTALDVPADEAPALLLRHDATISLSPSHLDVAFPLAALPIQVRVAGLDRDPGFVPAAGLTISFSYA